MTATSYGLSLAWAALALGLYRTILPSGCSWFGMGALALCSANSLGAGIFPTDANGVAPTVTSALHRLLATMFFACICPGMLALATAWRHDWAWMSRTRATFALAGTALAGLIFLAVGPPELSGLAQCWTLASVLAWHLLAAWQVNDWPLAGDARHDPIQAEPPTSRCSAHGALLNLTCSVLLSY